MKHKLPALFHERIAQIYSKQDCDIIYTGYETLKRNPSFRINTLRALPEMVLDILTGQKCELKKIDFIPNCYILTNGTEKDLWDLDLFKA
jgi:16S rRNA C967 or C1407 C5-methylase (RsmB/RsmF family)